MNIDTDAILERSRRMREDDLRTECRHYILTSHGAVQLGHLVNLGPHNSIKIYTPIGTCLDDEESPWPNQTCDSVAPPGKPKTSKSRKPFIEPFATYENCFYEMEFWPLEYNRGYDRKIKSGVKKCLDNSIVIDFNKDYPEGISLTEVISIIQDKDPHPFSLHLQCCMNLEEHEDREQRENMKAYEDMERRENEARVGFLHNLHTPSSSLESAGYEDHNENMKAYEDMERRARESGGGEMHPNVPSTLGSAGYEGDTLIHDVKNVKKKKKTMNKRKFKRKVTKKKIKKKNKRKSKKRSKKK